MSPKLIPPRTRRRPPTRVFLARHGQTMSNQDGLFCGHSETSLTDLGREQARALAKRLANTEIHAVYTSDFSRSIETAAIVLEGRGLSPNADSQLREICYGEWEMQRERHIAKSHPEEFRRMRSEDPAWQPPGGENLAIVRARMFGAFKRITAAHKHQNVLIVSHGTAIQCLLAEVLGMDPAHTFRTDVANCGLSEIVVQAGKPVVHLLNETWYLPPPGPPA